MPSKTKVNLLLFLMDIMSGVANNIAMLIKASGKSKAQIAKALGVTHATVYQYTVGLTFPSLTVFKKLCMILDCTYEDILGRL